jgi:hypothetical protein
MHLTRSFGQREEMVIPDVSGGYSGGENRIRDLIFKKTLALEYARLPDSRACVVMTGTAARKSVESKEAHKNLRVGPLTSLS